MTLDISKPTIKLGLYAGIITAIIVTLFRLVLIKSVSSLSTDPIPLNNFYKSLYEYLVSSTLIVTDYYATTVNEVFFKTAISSMATGTILGLLITILKDKIPGENFFRKSMYMNLVFWILTDVLVVLKSFSMNIYFLISLFVVPVMFSYIYSKIFDKLA
ncbi:MAG: hypothetical protein J4428_05760 [Candidatus Aenigmarchaeota archaeon]|nr:hypothetical protein [Candidatus Aenigmarchaeota archaeon]